MESAFNHFVSSNNLFDKTSKVLAAVSGGVDSVVLVELLISSGIDFSIAHCNFQLRGADSEADSAFVNDLAAAKGVPFFSKKFETKEYAGEHRISIQMAARDLRYAWFKEVLENNNLSCIATAHHLDDSVETFFLNLVRGTGIRGLTGIEAKKDDLVRPLLYTNKEEILEYARQKELAYREDRSNEDSKYDRNFIRHKIIPQLESLNPGFADTMSETMDKLKAAKEPYENYVKDLKAKLLEGHDTIRLSIEELRKLSPLNHYLFELLSSFGFNASDVTDIAKALNGESGKQFISKTHKVIKDRDFLLIDKVHETSEAQTITIEKGTEKISVPIALSFELQSRQGLELPTSDRIACLDNSKLRYPLKLRKWLNGDSMHPLGMVGSKNLSDIFIDKKIPMNEKENIFVLESGGEIAWVVGYKIDDRYKITETTEHVCLIKLCNGD